MRGMYVSVTFFRFKAKPAPTISPCVTSEERGNMIGDKKKKNCFTFAATGRISVVAAVKKSANNSLIPGSFVPKNVDWMQGATAKGLIQLLPI